MFKRVNCHSNISYISIVSSRLHHKLLEGRQTNSPWIHPQSLALCLEYIKNSIHVQCMKQDRDVQDECC